jgi:hypothetical protein
MLSSDAAHRVRTHDFKQKLFVKLLMHSDCVAGMVRELVSLSQILARPGAPPLAAAPPVPGSESTWF